MTGDKSVEQLREELRNLGYLSRGIERWFALDPWSSRTFWAELALVALKGGTVIAPFAAAPLIAIMSLRNLPLSVTDVLLLAAIELAGAFLISGALLVGTALLLKVEPSFAIDSPRLLMSVSLAISMLLAGGISLWWLGFDPPPRPLELLIGAVLLVLFLAVSTVVVSAALLSFSIHETHRLPRIHQRSRTIPITCAGIALLLALLTPAWFFDTETSLAPPASIAIRPSERPLALIAVDGLELGIFRANEGLREEFRSVLELPVVEGRSAAEVWATIGTGTPPELHRVRAIEAVRLAGSQRTLQSVSRFDPILELAATIRLAEKKPITPTLRNRHYIWEIIASRGVPSAAVNWWASGVSSTPALILVPQEQIFRTASQGGAGRPESLATAIDRASIAKAIEFSRGSEQRRFVAVYLPALDIILNRVELAPSDRLSRSFEILNGIASLLGEFRMNGYDVVLVGASPRASLLASTLPLESRDARTDDVVPTLADLFGFPASDEMHGRSLIPRSTQSRIPTYGSRNTTGTATRVDQEYYDNLKSLGYIR